MKLIRSKALLMGTLGIMTVLIGGCRRKSPSTVPCNLTCAKKGLEEYYESGKFHDEIAHVVNRSLNYFRYHHDFKDGDTVIFDIDDTLLWSYPDMKNIQFGYVPKMHHEWVLKARTPRVPEIKRLYDYLVQQGCKIVLLTGRRSDEREATLNNLKHAGFNHIDLLIMREPHEIHDTAQDYKTRHRALLASHGWRIIACIGDQDSDLDGGHTGCAIKIPNYMYIIE